jgi:hypothetical protein
MRRLSILFYSLMLLSISFMGRAAANLLLIDASIGGFIRPSDVCDHGVCGPTGHFSDIYDVHPGDVVDFGKITLLYYGFEGSVYGASFLISPGGPGISPSRICLNALICTLPDHPVTYDLIYTVPGGVTQTYIQWSAGAAYSPPTIRPVPEPSTWAMLLIGFAGIEFAGYRRKNKMALKAA